MGDLVNARILETDFKSLIRSTLFQKTRHIFERRLRETHHLPT